MLPCQFVPAVLPTSDQMIEFRGVAAFAPPRAALAHLGLRGLPVRRLLRRLPLAAPAP
uniref:Uncharacterized protein n=1 Tax=Triticum urartu TaxID=4572 RepID=A0A8R7PDF4_TRIUA